MAPYAQQVLLCTGKDDWAKRIEEEFTADADGVKEAGEVEAYSEGWRQMGRLLKEMLGRGGKFADVRKNPHHLDNQHSLLFFSRPS